MTLAWSAASATRRSGVRSISSACEACERLSQCGRMRSVKRDAGGDGVDVDAVGPELEGELAGEGDDAALGRGIGAGAVVAEATAGDRGQVHDLAAALLLHHRDDRVRAEEGGVEIEGDELLPVGEAQLLGRRLRIGDHRAAAHRVDQDVDGAVVARHVGDQLFDLRGIQGIDQLALHLAARLAGRLAERRHGLVEMALVVVGDDHRGAFAHHDLGRGAADAVAACGDQRHLVLEAHQITLRTM